MAPSDSLENVKPHPRWWLVVRGLLGAAVSSAALVALYYALPLDRWSNGHTFLEMSIALALLIATVAWHVRAIVRSAYPAIRAIEALAVTVPLFLLLFAATYYGMSRDDPAAFTQQLNRSDAVYFTVTVFSTVGFGDITPDADVARLTVTVQMLLDLVVLGLGIQVIIGAVKRGQRQSAEAESEPNAKARKGKA